jgi:hypothetical protein
MNRHACESFCHVTGLHCAKVVASLGCAERSSPEQDHHATSQARRDAVQKMSEFEQYKITDKIFREAERQAPRERGRPAKSGKQSRQES